jgi:hypothetical protein
LLGRAAARNDELADVGGLLEDLETLLRRGPAREQDLEIGAAIRRGRGAPERTVDRLRGLEHRALRTLGAHVGADVRAVGGDRVRVAVDVAQREVGERVRRGSRVGPDRRPQHERDAAGPGTHVGRRKCDAAADARDHGAVAAGGGDPGDRPLRRPDDGEREAFVLGASAAVAHVAADQGEDHVLAFVQGLERADPERRRVVGDEQDRLAHRSASS